MTDNKDEINNFIENNDEKEIRQIIEISKNQKNFTWKDFDDSISPQTWGNAIQKRVLEPVNSRQYKIQHREYIENKLSVDIEKSKDSEYIEGRIDSKDNKKQNKEEKQLENSQNNDKENINNKNNDNKNTNDSNNSKNEEMTDIDEEELPDINPKDADWTKIDKTLGMISFGSVLGFTFEPIRNTIYYVLNIPLDLLVNTIPFYIVILILAFLTSLWSMYIKEIYLDTSTKDYKKHINKLSAENSYFQVAEDATAKEENEFIKIQQAMLKTQTKPFVWSLSITLPILVWMFTVTSVVGLGQTITFPIFGETTYSGFVFLIFQAYIFWYIICSIISSQIIKKILIIMTH